jgi:carboxypeptidase Q
LSLLANIGEYRSNCGRFRFFRLVFIRDFQRLFAGGFSMIKQLTALLLLLASAHLSLPAQTEQVDPAVNARIRSEAAKSSDIMRVIHFLADAHSPRMTGTPSLRAAQDWVKSELEQIGLQNVRFETWDFGFPGWQNERLSVHAVEPFKDSLVAEAMAWTPGTRGPVTAETLHLIPPANPTIEELNAYLTTVKTGVKGRIVLTGKHNIAPINFEPLQLRMTDEEANRIFAPEKPRPVPTPTSTPAIVRLSALEVNDEVDKFLKTNGALARVHDAREPHGVVRAVINRTRETAQYIPTIVLRNEDYGRITRILADRRTVKLEINIVNRLFPAGRIERNVLAEIPGTDKKDELVMLGAHLDSHHLATGATDNAVGVAVMLEAVRILRRVGIRPRRTIRIGLWSGEEQRVLGSLNYVRAHFGSAENPTAEFDKLSAYFNLDSGTGKVRGMRVFGPAAAGEALRQTLVPFADLGVVGASTYSNRTAPGSDHAAFSVNGLPGVYIDQDPLEYGRYTWHTNLDTYERVSEEEAKQAATIVASAVYHLAMREEKLPRFSREQMPALNYFPTAKGQDRPR